MIRRIKDLLSDSLFYGISKFLGQVLGFVLIPLYTSYLLPQDYGILAIAAIYAVVVGLVSNFGFESAVYRYLGLGDSDELPTIHTSYFFVLFSSVIFFILGLLYSAFLSDLFLGNKRYGDFIVIAACIALVSSLKTIPFVVLRIKRRVKIVAWSSFINICFSIISTLFLIIGMELGALGALLGNLIGSIASLVVLLCFVPFPKLSNFSFSILFDLMKYASYLLPHRVFALSIPYYAQFFIAKNLDLTSLGLYALALKFCTPYTLLVSIFQQSWAPYKFVILKEEKSPKSFFRDFFSIYFLITVFIYFLFYFFADNLLILMTPEKYHDGASFIKYVACIPLCTGLFYMVGTGNEFSKTPKARPFISLAGLISVVVMTYYFVPLWGVKGAALSIAVSWLVMAAGNFIYAQHLFSIKYQWSFILKVLVTSVGIVFVASRTIHGVWIEMFYLVLFLLVLYLITPGMRQVLIDSYSKFARYRLRKK